MLSAKETIEFWAEKVGLGRKGKNKRKRMQFREAKKLERQSRYGNKWGKKAVETQRRKKKQMMRIQKGKD